MPFIQEKKQPGPLLYLAVQFLNKKKKKENKAEPPVQGSLPQGKKSETILSVLPSPRRARCSWQELQGFCVHVTGRYTESLQRATSKKP